MSKSFESDSKTPENRERFLSVLNDITYAALEIQDFDELLQLLADRLAEIIQADGCFITLWDDETRTTTPGAAYGPLRDSYKSVSVPTGEPTITQAVVDAGHTIVIEDAWNSGYAASSLTRQFPSKSMLALPIKIGDTNLGAAMISFDSIHHFLPIEIEYCEQAVRQISLAVANLVNISALRASEQKYRELAKTLREREAHLDQAQAYSKLGSWQQDSSKENTRWSSGLFRLFNLPPADRPPSKAELLDVIAEADRELMTSILGRGERAEEIFPIEFRTIHGKHLIGHAFRDTETKQLMGTVQDVTEQRKLETELFQARKMEAVGTLAGGIAHNFNNILTVIMGNYELLKSSIPNDSSDREVLNQCLEATERAALLTRQLLVVSRKHELNPESINVNQLIKSMTNLLRPLVGGHIELRESLDLDVETIKADKGHLEQVIMNLVLNSKDAVHNGGLITVSTQLSDGDTVQISVTDDGPGISQTDLPNIFDPFYTTKDEGKGTGLGLATVQSIVQQSNGRIHVDSELDQGTCITLSLPAVAGSKKRSETINRAKHLDNPANDQTSVKAGTHGEANIATVLLVEDHESLRNIATLVLETAGYKVISAESGPQAIDKVVSHSELIDLLITDIQLPEGMSGVDLAQRIQSKREVPLPTIFMSGLRQPLPSDDHYHFLPKPFRPKELIEIVSRVLAL